MSGKNLLIIDDEIISRKLLIKFFQNDYELFIAENGEEALNILNENKNFSAIILDVVMPKMNGFELLQTIKNDVVLSSIPVIIMSADENPEVKKRSLELGAVGFITKPLDSFEVRHTVNNIVNLYDSLFNNISQIDSLTGLYKREAFLDKVSELVKSHPANYYVLSCFDVEKFKVINDLYGITFGDKVLKHIANCLKMAETELQGIASRLQSDKFAILYPVEFIGSDYYKHFHERLSTPHFFKKKIKIRIGRYRITDTSVPVHLIFDRAALAEESIKGIYGKYIAEYTESMRTKLIEEQEIVSDSRRALMAGEFEVWFQPQYNNTTGSLTGAEALVRWRHQKKGLLDPGTFIPIFERNEFIYSIDKFMWEHVCMFIRKWIDEKREIVPISVNISRVDIFKPDFFEKITGYVKKYNVPIDFLNLEVTESAFSESSNELIEIVSKLVKYGFTVEIDDFGCGYSSLNILKDVPSQVLKLDMRFLESSKNSERSGTIIESVIRMARWIGMTVIAEGVEEQFQADYLKSIGCYYIQGYLYSKPIPFAEYEKVLKDGKKELRMVQEFTVKKLDNTKFWDPKSMDTIMFNSYIGGAFIFEYRNEKIELLRINEKYKETLGKFTSSDGDLENLDIRNHLFGEDKQKFLDLMNLSIEKKTEVFENLCLKESEDDNENIEYVKLTMKVIAISDNSHLFYGVLENYTAQKLAEQKEKKISNKLESIMNYSPCGITAIILNEDNKTNFLLMNKKFFELLGYTEEQFNCEIKNGFDCIIAEDKDRVISEVSKLNQVGQKLQLDMRAERRDGEVIWLRCMVNVIQMDDVEGAVQLSSFYDITAEKIAENHLKFVNESSQSIISYSDSNTAMNKILENLLSYFDADRAYIIEIDRNNNVLNNTYEICTENVKPRIQDIQNVLFSTTFSWIYKLEKNKFIYYDKSTKVDNTMNNDLLNQYGITSLILAPLWQEKTLIGYSAVENPKRLINQAENLVAMCSYISILISRRNYEINLRNAETELLDNLPCGAALYRFKDNKIDVLHINKHYWELVNRKETNYFDSSVIKAVHEDDKDSILQEINAAITAKREINIDVRILYGKKDYKLFHIQGIIKPSDDFYLLYVTYIPVSEKNMSLKELIPVALSSIMKSSPDMMFVKDIGLHYISASPSTLEITGCSNEREIVGKTDSELFEKSLWEKYVHDDIEIIKTKQPKINDRDFISTQDGEIHNVLTSKYPITDENEKVIGIYGVSRDITKIQQNEDQLRTISNNIPGGIFCIEFGNNIFKIVYINDVFFNTIDYSREKYIKNCMKDPYFIIHEDDKAGFKKVFTDYYKNPCQNQFIKPTFNDEVRQKPLQVF